MSFAGAADRRAVRVLAPLGLFLLAVAVRALPWRSVLTERFVLPFGNDAFYHMRRIIYSVVHFPAALEFDPYVSFPAGAKPIWTPVFDWIVALLVRPFYRADDLTDLERAVVWVPPLLGGATVVALYFIARVNFGNAVALLSGVTLSLLSGHFWYSQIGFVDHHAAVAFSSTLLLGASMGLLRRHAGLPAGSRGAWLACLATGTALAGTLLVWPGSLLHVGLVEVAFLVYLLSRPQREQAVDFALRLAAVHGVAFLLVAPLGLSSDWPQWSRFTPVVLSSFQPWLFGTLACYGLACAWLWRRPVGRTGSSRSLSGLLLGVVLVAASALAIPDLLVGVEDAWRWFAKRESFQAMVAESRPLITARVGVGLASARLSWFAFLVPAVCALAGWSVRRDRQRAAVFLLLWWSLGLLAVTLVQKRFFNSSSVAVALLMGWAAVWAYRALPSGLRAHPAGRAIGCATLACALLALLAPMSQTYQLYVSSQLRLFGDQKVPVSVPLMRQGVAIRTAGWLRRNTPPTAGWLDPSARPEYGVLAPWPMGHVIGYVARRPTVVDNFGNDLGERNFQLALRYYEGDEAAAREILDQLGVRYVIAQDRSAFLGKAPPSGSMFYSLYYWDGTGYTPGARGGSDPQPVVALEQHRLIFESRPLRRGPERRPSLFKVFEYVAGAQVTGRAAPGAPVRVSLELVTNRKREIEYTTSTIAGSDGRYRVRLPYANRGGPDVVRVAPHYTFESEGAVAQLSVDEESVLEARELAGPDLRAHTRR